MNATAPLAEVFTSFQGEGPLVGVRQLFVRVRGCDLACDYCDTPASRILQGPCRVEVSPGSGRFRDEPNPVTPEQVLSWAPPGLHSVALTGGEPLLYPGFVRDLARQGAARGLPVYLETAGHRPEELAAVVADLGFVSLDFKLPSTLRRPVDPALFVRSYQVAQGKVVAVKIVVTDGVNLEETRVACTDLATISPRGPLVLQPATPVPGGPLPPGVERLHLLHEIALEYMADVRVIPQCHRLLGAL